MFKACMVTLCVLLSFTANVVVAQSDDVTKTPEDRKPTWRGLNPLLLGEAAEVLQSPDTVFLDPQREFDLPAELGFVIAMASSNDARHVFIASRGRESYRVDAIDLADGTIAANVLKLSGSAYQPEIIPIAGADSILWRADHQSAPTRFDSIFDKSEAPAKSIRMEEPGAPLVSFLPIPGAGTLIGTSRPGHLLRWDLTTGQTQDAIKLSEDVLPYLLTAGGNDTVLALTRTGNQEKPAFEVMSVNWKTGAIGARAKVPSGLVDVATDRSSFFAVGLESDHWGTIEVFDADTLKRRSSTKISVPVSSIGYQLLNRGNLLLLHEYMVQPILAIDTQTGAVRAVLGPQGGGIHRFAVSPDGTRLAAITGPWINGSLQPKKLSVYDLTVLEK